MFAIMSDFGTCNNIITLVLFKLWRIEEYFNFPAFGINKTLMFGFKIKYLVVINLN